MISQKVIRVYGPTERWVTFSVLSVESHGILYTEDACQVKIHHICDTSTLERAGEIYRSRTYKWKPTCFHIPKVINRNNKAALLFVFDCGKARFAI